MNKQGILTMLGFAQKAGKLAAGEAAVENFLKKQKIVLIVVSEEISENRMIFWKRQAEFYNVPLVTVDIEKIDLGWAIGSSPKTVIGIMSRRSRTIPNARRSSTSPSMSHSAPSPRGRRPSFVWAIASSEAAGSSLWPSDGTVPKGDAARVDLPRSRG